MGAAQHERRQRVVRAGEARLVEPEQRQIGLQAGGDAAEVVAAETAREPSWPSATRRDG